MKKFFGNFKAAAGSKHKEESPSQSELGSRSSSGEGSSRGAPKGTKKGSNKNLSTANGDHDGSPRDPPLASPKPRSSKPRASPSPRSSGAASSEGSSRKGNVSSSPSTQGRQGSRKGREGTGSREGGSTPEAPRAAVYAADAAVSRRATASTDPGPDITPTSSVGYNSSSDLPPGALDGYMEASDMQRGSDAMPDYSFDSEQSGSSKGGFSQHSQLESASALSIETHALSIGSQSGSFGEVSARSNQATASTPRWESSLSQRAEGSAYGSDSRGPRGSGAGNSRGSDSAQSAGRPSAEDPRPSSEESIDGKSAHRGEPVAGGRAAQGGAGAAGGGAGPGGAGRGGGGVSGSATPREVPELPLLEALEACEAEEEEEQLRGLRSLRTISRGSKDARVEMVSEGVVSTMLRMQHSPREEVLNLALLVLLNVSCDEESVSDMGVTIPFIEMALQHGSSEVRESAAALVFSLSLHSFHRESLLSPSVVSSLVPILASGTDQGKRDCCKALFHLSYLPKSYKILIKAGAVEPAVDLLSPPDSKIAEKATCLLANITRCTEGCEAIAAAPEGIFNLVEILNEGSPLAKEFAAAALLLIAQSDRRHRKSLMLESPFIALDGLQNTGSARAKLKASALLKLLGEQKEEDASGDV